jgi:hypothetical protein
MFNQLGLQHRMRNNTIITQRGKSDYDLFHSNIPASTWKNWGQDKLKQNIPFFYLEWAKRPCAPEEDRCCTLLEAGKSHT